MTTDTFPKTRYQGSKLKIIDWLSSHLSKIEANIVLDAFSGTSCVSHIMKKQGRTVYSNDIMPCNFWVAKALVENQTVYLSQEEAKELMVKKDSTYYKSFIFDNFSQIYYLDEENQWLDIVIQNIHNMESEYKKAIALWAIFQSCIIKRPYNLFHRKNLHIRTADVPRSFGNKTTWDKPFEHFFLKFIKEANQAIFQSQKGCKSLNLDILDDKLDSNIMGQKIDLVYLDPPYIPLKGSLTTYHDFYHFLNGLVQYDLWESQIDYSSKHLKLKSTYSIWEDKKNIITGFEKVFNKFEESTIAISYRNDGIPTIDELVFLLEKKGKKVEIHYQEHQYVLSKNKGLEALIIAK